MSPRIRGKGRERRSSS